MILAGAVAWSPAAASAPMAIDDPHRETRSTQLPPTTLQPPARACTPQPAQPLAVAVSCIDAGAAALNAGQAAGSGTKTTTGGHDAPPGPQDLEMHHRLLAAATIMAAIFGVIAVLFFFASAIQSRGGAFHIVSYWGGFGGTGAGWQLTSSAVSLMAAIVLAIVSAALLLGLLSATGASAPAASPPAHPETH
jgi:hypothetical protein